MRRIIAVLFVLTLVTLTVNADMFDDSMGMMSPVNPTNLMSPHPIAAVNPANIYHNFYYGESKQDKARRIEHLRNRCIRYGGGRACLDKYK